MKIETLPLTLTELVTSVTGSVPRIRRDLIERRLAHWAAHGILEPIGELHVGSGRSRVFDQEQAYIAAVLLRLGLSSVDGLKAVAQVISLELARSGETAELWKATKERLDAFHNGAPVFVAFSIALNEAGEKPVAIGIRLARGTGGLSTPSFYIQSEEALTIINLSETFAGVRFP